MLQGADGGDCAHLGGHEPGRRPFGRGRRLGRFQRRTAQAATAARQLVLISDLQQGSRLESLQGYQWPEGVLLEVKPVSLKRSANAGLTLVKDAADSEDARNARRPPASAREQPGGVDERAILARVEQRRRTAQRCRAHQGLCSARLKPRAAPRSGRPANCRPIAWSCRATSTISTTRFTSSRRGRSKCACVYVGDDAADDVQGLRYFLESALPQLPAARWSSSPARGQEAIEPGDLLDTRLVVVTANVSENQAAALRPYLEQGGCCAVP